MIADRHGQQMTRQCTKKLIAHTINDACDMIMNRSSRSVTHSRNGIGHHPTRQATARAINIENRNDIPRVPRLPAIAQSEADLAEAPA